MEQGAVDGMPVVELPRSHVLSYVTTVTSATRVREVAGLGLKLLAWGQVAFAVFLLAWGCWSMWEAILDSGGTAGAGIWDYIRCIQDQFATENAIPVVTGVVMACLGPALLLCARPVQAGSRAGCMVAKTCVVPTVLVLYVGTALLACYAIILGTGAVGGPVNRWYLLLLLLLPPLALLLAALRDLRGFLGWIARNPATEKPRVAFLS